MSRRGLQGNKLYCICLILYLFNSTNFQVYHFHIAHNTPHIPPRHIPRRKNLENGLFQMSSHARVKKTKGKIPGEYITWSELGKPNIQAKGDVTRDKQQRRFLAQYCSVATLLRYGFDWLQHCFNIAMLCCAKNRRWESSHVSLHVTSRRPVR